VKFSNKYTNIFITGLEHNVNNKKLFWSYQNEDKRMENLPFGITV
jgi:hypothetical protein